MRVQCHLSEDEIKIAISKWLAMCDERDRQKQQQERTMSEALKVGDRVLATWIDECGDKQTVSGTVANLRASGTMAQIDYLEKSWVLLPLSNLQRIPPSQAEPVAVTESQEQIIQRSNGFAIVDAATTKSRERG